MATPTPLPPRTQVPRHVAIIMDGNGRWARRRGWNRVRGHRAGIDSVRAVVREARAAGVRYLTLFAFSSENWGRPQREIAALMGLLRRFLRVEVPDLKRNGVRVRAIGELRRLPPRALEAVRWAEDETREGRDLDLILALSYGGRDEILHAVRSALAEGVRPEELDEARFRGFLYAPDVPDPDLLIRTSGEMRISNFLLWQLAYTELYVTPTLWPEFREAQFREALADYARRERRFGLTSEQLAGGGGG
ncbi:polyprenyl diphosphate synthase [Deferrisoma camini]|uniref:polyprenyl diphosphate synthase n=1 Tax=Deferrisoma camini TaxID=1035120 RepID=UPI00046C930D|nr:polyprenyl diphosphate synthase [Deferrisoma camini]